jgi:dUTP pyrophosphatase
MSFWTANVATAPKAPAYDLELNARGRVAFILPASLTSDILGTAGLRHRELTLHRVSGAELVVPIRMIDDGLPLPAYARAGDAGADLATAVDVVIEPGQRVLVPTGVSIALPDGYAGFVQPRSGLAARSGLTIVNAPGTVDAGYRGESSLPAQHRPENTDRTAPRRPDRSAGRPAGAARPLRPVDDCRPASAVPMAMARPAESRPGGTIQVRRPQTG